VELVEESAERNGRQENKCYVKNVVKFILNNFQKT